MATQSEKGLVYRLLDAAVRGDLKDLKRIALQLSVGGELVETFTELRDAEGRTALHLAAGEGKTNICRYLIRDLKVNIDLRDHSGDSPLNFAVLSEQYQTATFLIENGANVKLANNKRFSALHYAAQKGHKKLVELVMSKGADVEAESAAGTPLQCAAANGKKETVKLLLDSNANPNVVGSLLTPLMVSLLSRSIECTILLLKAGADPNLRSLGGPPLVYAAGAGETEAIRFLLKNGADANVVDAFGETPLEAAAGHGCHEGIMMLLPLTHRIPDFPVWSLAGIIGHVHSEQYRRQKEQKKKEMFKLSKLKGEEAFKRKDYLEAIFWYTQASFTNPSDATVLSNRSLCWVHLGEGQKALNDAEACINLKPDWPKAHYREGVARKMIKDLCGSTEAFSQALKLDPENQEIKTAHREAVEAEFGIPVSENLRTFHL